MTIYRATETPRAWSAVVNMAGYLPESEGFLTEDPKQAREYLADELERNADDDGGDYDQGQVSAVLAELRADNVSDEVLWYLDWRSDLVAYSVTELNPSDFAVCADCGTLSDPEDSSCWVCGSGLFVPAADYDTDRPADMSVAYWTEA